MVKIYLELEKMVNGEYPPILFFSGTDEDYKNVLNNILYNLSNNKYILNLNELGFFSDNKLVNSIIVNITNSDKIEKIKNTIQLNLKIESLNQFLYVFFILSYCKESSTMFSDDNVIFEKIIDNILPNGIAIFETYDTKNAEEEKKSKEQKKTEDKETDSNNEQN